MLLKTRIKSALPRWLNGHSVMRPQLSGGGDDDGGGRLQTRPRGTVCQ